MSPGAAGTRRRRTALVLAAALGATATVWAAAQSGEVVSERREIVRLDALLGAGDTAEADALLASLAPSLASDDRLAFDTIYVLVGRGRTAEARTQWNRLAARLKESLRARSGTATDAQRTRRLGEALFAQALLVAEDGEKAEALRLLAQADASGFPPLDSRLMLLAADCLRGLQEYGLAANAYREYLARFPESVPGRLGLATALYAARGFEAARAELEELLRHAPGTPRANYLLGAVLVEQGRYEDATVHLERELTSDPRCAGCLSRLAHVAYLEGRDSDCASLLERAAALDPGDVETRMIAGLLAFRREQYAVAIDHLSFVVDRSPEYLAARYQLAMAYRRTGDAGKAREQLDAYQRLLQARKARENDVRGEQ